MSKAGRSGSAKSFNVRAAAASARPLSEEGTQPAGDTFRSGGVVNPNARTTSTTLAHLTESRFSQLNVAPETKRAINEVMGYDSCTKVQADAIPAMLAGGDVVCKAKTGTGKTLAFLIPAIDNMLHNPPPPGSVGVLVISPARELAMQIEAEAKQLTRFHKLTTQVIVGGTSINKDKAAFRSNPPDILIATPGRLNDHLENEDLMKRMYQLRVLVFDEADRLLDMGFRRDIDKMLGMLPHKEKRQTVLFSATFPQDTDALCKYALRPNFGFVDTVGTDIVDTNTQVEQEYLITPLADQLASLHKIIQAHKAEEPEYKIMVFFVTANQTALASELFQKTGEHILEMHSRKSQAHRTRTADSFRGAKKGIMFSSDVSARGVDYPDVSLVIQVGVPSEKAQYVHRVGRTARAGKTGHGILLLADFEQYFMRQLSDLPVKPLQLGDVSANAQVLARALPHIDEVSKSKAYSAFLGFYKSQKGMKWSKEELVQNGNYYSSLLGCPEPPALMAKTVGMMGLKGVPGLKILKGAHPGSQRNSHASPASSPRAAPRSTERYSEQSRFAAAQPSSAPSYFESKRPSNSRQHNFGQQRGFQSQAGGFAQPEPQQFEGRQSAQEAQQFQPRQTSQQTSRDSQRATPLHNLPNASRPAQQQQQQPLHQQRGFAQQADTASQSRQAYTQQQQHQPPPQRRQAQPRQTDSDDDVWALGESTTQQHISAPPGFGDASQYPYSGAASRGGAAGRKAERGGRPRRQRG